ncbi:MAG: hypothetical protein ACLQA5_22745 [Solirubrobacteraceae bacterium]
MASLPRPLIGLLVATLAAFGLWYVELKPSSSASGGSSQGGLGQYQSAINQAHQAVKISGAANARLGAPTATGPAPNSPTPAKTATAAKPVTATATAVKPATTTKTAATATKSATTKTRAATAKTAKPAAKALTTAQQVSLITSAIENHKVVAVLFYNTAAADDQAMAKELGTVSTHGGQVVTLAVPLSELTNFSIITQQIPVVTAPTLVLIDADRQATTLTGFADTVEISQRIDDALAAK